jgi:hypothetical protein
MGSSCPFADHFRAIGEPEISALLSCGVDFAVQDAARTTWELKRIRTRMQGAPFCDLRRKLRRP